MTTECTFTREQFNRRASRDCGPIAGLEYDYDLTGPGGAFFTIFRLADTTQEQEQAAIAEAHRRFDVVGYQVVTLPAGYLEPRANPTPGAAVDWTGAARWIVENRTAHRVLPQTGELVPDNRRGGMLLDLFSASRMLAVHDALSDSNKARFSAMDVRKAHKAAFNL